MADNYLKLQQENNKTDALNDQLKKQLNATRQKLEMTLLDVDNVQKPINEENKSIRSRDASGRDINNMIVVWSHWAHSALKQECIQECWLVVHK